MNVANAGPLIESIRFVHGTAPDIDFHAVRMNRSRAALFGCSDPIELSAILNLPEQLNRNSLYRCRVLYTERVLGIEWIPYERRIIRTLRLVEDDSIDYTHKYEDRSRINALYLRRSGCDEILIVKRGLITDTSFSNIAFFDGRGWITPAAPLLKGTKRERLLREGVLIEGEIAPDDLQKFSGASLINAFLDPERDAMIQIKNIFPYPSDEPIPPNRT
jgi:4-amino-4-deoxychorismate lyase